MKQWRKLTAIIMMTVMLLLQGANLAMAVDIGGGATVTRIKYQVVRDENYNITQALVEFTGENLLNKVVLFSTDQGTQAMGKKLLQYENFLQYSFTPEEVGRFTGEVRIGTGIFNLDLGNFPTIDSTTRIVNVSSNGSLIINGRNLDQFKEVGDYVVRGEYGKAGQYKTFGESNPDSNTITVTNATPPGDKGLQSIRLIKEKKAGATVDPAIIVEYNYNNIFSFVSDIDVNDIEMYPNTGSKGDQVYFRSEEFTKAYDVYFFKTLDGTEGFSDKNRAIFKGFVPKSNESPALLTVEVPQGVALGRHYVVLAETINNQVVAQKVIKKGTEFVEYTVVDATNRPRITDVYPGRGPDIGGTPVGIEGRNLLRSSINPSELTIDYSESNREIKLSTDKQEVTVTYNAATYQGKEAIVIRNAKVQIGSKVVFQETESGKPRVDIGSTSDKLYIITPKVDDANISPQKEVLIEITTVVKEKDTNKEYVFEERALWDRRFIFDPSSLIPSIDNITPSRVQVIEGQLKDDTLISTKGKNFLVNRYMDDHGDAIINYPRILIKTANDIDTNNYEFMIQKRNGEAKAYYRDGGGDLVEITGAEIVVLDDADRIIDGTVGREVGTRLLVRLPKEVPATIGMKNLQITNPTRESNEAGQSNIKIDALEFITTNDSPEIDEVVPNIVPVDGGQEIQVKGSNFLEGVKVFIDGKEVPGVSRDIAPQGDKFILRFKAPKGREGTTQLLVMNPSGGMAVAEFIYVQTLQKDPQISGFSPNKGGNGTLVFVKGDNFLKPDPTTRDTSGIGIYRLIGTRILLDGKDINSYYTVGNNIALQPYQSNPDPSKAGPLLKNEGPMGVKLADYYHSLILVEEGTDKYYTFEIDAGERIVLSDGVQNTYKGFRFSGADGKYIAAKNGLEYEVEIQSGTGADGDKLIITNNGTSTTLKIMTPYAISDGIITGNRVQVLSRSEIIFYVPQLGTEKWYDLSVQNPDTKIDTRTGQNGFYYFKQPKKNPTIISLEPSQGSADGGYAVDIIGEDFEDNGIDKSRVFIGGVEVPKADVIVSTDQKKITIRKMPAYSGDLKKESESGRKTVPVVIVNSDGGNAYLQEGFTYVIPTSNPRINRIAPDKGNAAGGEIVRIFGSDFRFFEPYEDANGNAKYDKGERFENINGDIDSDGNPVWTNLEGKKIEDLSDKDKLILPRVYFGKEQAEIIEFSDGYLVAKLPKAEKGAVDVFLVNNDFGVSNKVKFTYEATNPRINSIIPAVGKKQGGDKIELNGVDFAQSELQIYIEGTDASGTQNIETVEMPLVHFGDIKDRRISNRHIPVTDTSGQGGSIVNGKAKVDIGNLSVDYDATSGTKKLTLSITKEEKSFNFTVNGYDDTVKYVNIISLKDSEGKFYDGAYEMVRIEVDRLERKLIVERGYTPYHSNMSFSSNQISLYSPSYHSIGTVPITLFNPDGGQATGKFEYRNPDSKPQITNITKDGRDPQLGKINNQDMKVHQISYRGGNILSIIGSDFRENATIQIGDVLTFAPDKIEYQLPDRLRVTMPAVNENLVGRLYRVTVINEDGASASSDKLTPPIYIQIIKGESAPTIESITPDRGPVKGGTVVTIKGKDFRETMDGYEGKRISVYFGEVKVPDKDVKFIDYKTLEVITPPNVPGKVDVKVENPDGELAQPIGSFTYLSSPTISAVVDPLDSRETTRITSISVEGGQTIKLKGSSFAAGARVVFAPVLKKAEKDQENNANAININGEWYILESGSNGTEVNVLDSETITVKTPPNKEGEKGVIVINPDKGASEIYQDIVYGLPKLQPPMGVEAELVYDRYIKVHWLEAEGAKGYEIYVVINDRKTEYIGNTTLTSFVYQELEPNTRYRFIIKTIGEYGLSIASDESNTVRTGKVVGPPDTDGGITESTTTSKSGDTVNVSIGTEDYYKKDIVVDLTKIEYAGINKAIITLPAKIVAAKDSRNITVIGPDYALIFNPNVFAYSDVLANSDKKDAGIRFTIEKNKGDTKTGSESVLSNQYLLYADFFTGKSSTKMEGLISAIDLTLEYDSAKADLRRIKEVYLGRYNDYNSSWESIATEKRGINSSIKATVNKLGIYTIFGKRG